jgi:hypothetical protein
MVFMNDFTVGAKYSSPTDKTYELLDVLGDGLSLQEVTDDGYWDCIVVSTMDFMTYFNKVE